MTPKTWTRLLSILDNRPESKRPRLYHIGLLVRNRTLVIQTRESKDQLSPQLRNYIGAFKTTKKDIRAIRFDIFHCITKDPLFWQDVRWVLVE